MLKVGEHKGQLAVIGAAKRPVAAYTMLIHDPAPKRLWELSWGETVEWLPSPAKPTMSDGRLLLMPKPEELKPKPGRFIATSVLVWNKDAIEKLDLRGGSPAPGIFDERDTTWFLSNVRDIVDDKRNIWPGAITVASAEYEVEL
jgi:hypothetical protein